MSREWTIYVRDMVACCDRILTYTEGVSREAFDQRVRSGGANTPTS